MHSDDSCDTIIVGGEGADESESVETRHDDYEKSLKSLLHHFVRHNLSLKCLEDTAKLINGTPGATIKIPTTKYKLIKTFVSMSGFKIEFHIFCTHCKIYSNHIVDGAHECEECSRKLKATETNHFIYIPLEEQLKRLLNRHYDSVLSFAAGIDTNNSAPVKDVHDGKVVKNLMKSKNNLLCVMINSDGVALKKSGNKSFWSIQVICNFLPPYQRYQLPNILSVGFYYNNEKPDMLKFFRPLAIELKSLESNGFIFKNQVFRVAVTHAVFDLPAKAMFLKMKQFNGYDACGFCFQAGRHISDVGVRYGNDAECAELRKHEDFVAAMSKIMNTSSDIDVKGVAGVCPAISFEYFDLVKSFCLDYMHNTLLGLTKQLLEFWLNPKLKHASLIKKAARSRLNQRIAAIKPPKFISRLPRSLVQRKKFKASEFRSLLLYYLPVCLIGILEKKYLEHYTVLSACIYKLLSTEITDLDLSLAEHHLKLFVGQFEELYGTNCMTMNVHLLLHIVFCVRNLGPLWAQSAFAFESNNAIFSRYVRGNVDILAQIHGKYILHKFEHFNLPSNNPTESLAKLTDPKVIQLDEADVNAMSAHNIKVENRLAFSICCVYENSTDRFTCTHYIRSPKRIDYFVLLKSGFPVKVKYYIEYLEKKYAIIEPYEVVDNINHISELISKDKVAVCAADEIWMKMIYMNFAGMHYMTDRPNNFESD